MRSDLFIRAAGGSYNAETRTFAATFSAGAPRQLRDASGPFLEVVDLSGFDPAALVIKTVFLDHRHSTDAAVGVVTAARREGAALVGEVQLSAAESVADVRTKVAEGVIGAVSIGYRVTKWTEGRDASGRRTKTAAAGELVELSLVGIPADPAAVIRSEGAMPTETEVTEQQQPAADPTPAPATPPKLTIRAHVAPTGSEDPAATYAAREDALFCRATGTQPSEAARPFMGFGFAEHAALALRNAGETGLHLLSREATLHRAMHGTSDFPALLTGVGNRSLREGYSVAASPLKKLAKTALASDFRTNDILGIEGFGTLSEVTEHGEITAKTTVEVKNAWALKTYAGSFALTRKALINDDLGAMGRVPAELGVAAAETENAALAALLLSNPIMSDGNALFSTAHGNEMAPEIIDLTTLDKARKAMRLQVRADGSPIAVNPKHLVVGPELETSAETATMPGPTPAWYDQNPFRNAFTVEVEPRIRSKFWYLFADPATAPVLLVGHLASAPGPQISSREGWEVLGREFRVVLDFAVAVTDWRGVVRNPFAG